MFWLDNLNELFNPILYPNMNMTIDEKIIINDGHFFKTKKYKTNAKITFTIVAFCILRIAPNKIIVTIVNLTTSRFINNKDASSALPIPIP